MNLLDKVALVTGGSRGIGRAIALGLAKKGADIVVNYAGNEGAAAQVKNEVESLGRKAIVVKADVSKAEEVDNMFKVIVDTFQRLDIIVNNAGITRDTLVLRMKVEDWDAVIDTNLKGVFLCAQKASKLMIKQRSGRIINISSVVGSTGNAGQLNYVASKAGVIGMTKTLAKEFVSQPGYN